MEGMSAINHYVQLSVRLHFLFILERLDEHTPDLSLWLFFILCNSAMTQPLCVCVCASFPSCAVLRFRYSNDVNGVSMNSQTLQSHFVPSQTRAELLVTIDVTVCLSQYENSDYRRYQVSGLFIVQS